MKDLHVSIFFHFTKRVLGKSPPCQFSPSEFPDQIGPDKLPNPNLTLEMGRNSPGGIDQEGKDFVLAKFRAVAIPIIPYHDIFFF